MLAQWQQWNRRAKLWLWVLVLIAVIAALPIGSTRMKMERTSSEVEYVFDYRDLVEIAEVQPKPREFVSQQLLRMKQAGITTLSIYESSLRELAVAGRLSYYSAKDAAMLQGLPPSNVENFTYVIFSGGDEQQATKQLVQEAYDRLGVAYKPWKFGGRDGLIIELGVQDALLKPMGPDQVAMKQLTDAGFKLLPRFSDRSRPYDQEETSKLLQQFKELGVDRILFDGDNVKGYADQGEMNSLTGFAELLKQYDLGIAAIENLKKPQGGINKIAYLTNYNVTRLYSLSADDAAQVTPKTISDRFLLAAKDRNIRMFFMNGGAQSSLEKAGVVHPLDKLYEALEGPDGAVARLTDAGFPAGSAEPFEVERPSWAKPLKAVVAVGAVALIALLVGAYVPLVLIPVFLIGAAGSAGLFVLGKNSLLEQALALGAAISAPTLALIWVMNRIYARTDGMRRFVGGSDWSVGRSGGDRVVSGTGEEGLAAASGMRWVFPGLTWTRRLGMAVMLFIMTSLISLVGVPFVFGLLNNVTYSLVLEQFRGVSLLHLAPIGLVALYVFLYTGQSVIGNVRKILRTPITVMWVVLGVVLAAAGVYYLSRTGNEGQASSIELLFRNWLESTFGVRPRTKEFLLSHPLLLLGIFLSLRYRAAWVLIIAGSIGQLSMVDTFAHIHTPLYISIIRVFLGLGLGVLFGVILIGVWQVVEGAWKRWAGKLTTKSVDS
ncbi:DUF5693 family protein [Paenibacillus sp. GCM10023252]|uniref:DUF5693 family protein n=1 Tax=Paenibacillus sp. GCM10023252 TaxID=3252649 RepID=UPI003620491A